MMRTIFLVWLLALTSASPSYATSKDTIIEDVLTLSGIDKQVEEISQFAISEIENRKEGLDEQEYQQLLDVLTRAFDSKRLYGIVQSTFEENYDESQFLQWRETLRTPLFIRISKLEDKVAESDQFQQIIDYVEQSKQSPPPQSRIELISRLDNATSATQLALDSQMAVLRTLLLAINPSLPDNQRISAGKLDQIVAATRMQLEATMKDIALATYLYTYKDVSEKDFATYVNVYESTRGQWMVGLTKKAIRRALQSASHEVEGKGI